MVTESAVLFAVQYLQQSCGRVPPLVTTHLVYFIQQKHRVAASCLPDASNNSAGHSPHIGLSVAPYVGLIPNATQ